MQNRTVMVDIWCRGQPRGPAKRKQQTKMQHFNFLKFHMRTWSHLCMYTVHRTVSTRMWLDIPIGANISLQSGVCVSFSFATNGCVIGGIPFNQHRKSGSAVQRLRRANGGHWVSTWSEMGTPACESFENLYNHSPLFVVVWHIQKRRDARSAEALPLHTCQC